MTDIDDLLDEVNRLRALIELNDDNQDIRRFSVRMTAKMALARNKGRAGWRNVSVPELWQLLHEQINKGHVIDIAIYCMMIDHLNSTLE